jgi:hypothetical protein
MKKVLTEIVFFNFGPARRTHPGMTGSELLHGFLADPHRASNPEVRHYVEMLCLKWNIHYRNA